MKVTIVAEQLRRPVPGGIGTYVKGLVHGLHSLAPPAPEVTLWASRAPRGGPDAAADLGPVACSKLPGWALVRAWALGRAAPAHPADVVHATSFAVPPAPAVPMTVMVHDLAWRHFPDAYPNHGRRWHEAALGRALERASMLVVPSALTADDLLAAGAPADRVEIIEEGADHLPPRDDVAADELLRRLGVDGDFMLTVSTLEPRKNLRRLVAAFQAARAKLSGRWNLVVVGPAGWGDSGVAPGEALLLAGHVTDAALSALYARAALMAYVPLREGFGLPVLEAMSSGAPVVASAVPGAGDAAFEVDPLDVASITDGLVRVATDRALRDDLVQAGRSRAEHLTWARAARRHIELWDALQNEGGA